MFMQNYFYDFRCGRTRFPGKKCQKTTTPNLFIVNISIGHQKWTHDMTQFSVKCNVQSKIVCINQMMDGKKRRVNFIYSSINTSFSM